MRSQVRDGADFGKIPGAEGKLRKEKSADDGIKWVGANFSARNLTEFPSVSGLSY
jgi:hypothetical protein